jgi:hypothetical protein
MDTPRASRFASGSIAPAPSGSAKPCTTSALPVHVSPKLSFGDRWQAGSDTFWRDEKAVFRRAACLPERVFAPLFGVLPSAELLPVRPPEQRAAPLTFNAYADFCADGGLLVAVGRLTSFAAGLAIAVPAGLIGGLVGAARGAQGDVHCHDPVERLGWAFMGGAGVASRSTFRAVAGTLLGLFGVVSYLLTVVGFAAASLLLGVPAMVLATPVAALHAGWVGWGTRIRT